MGTSSILGGQRAPIEPAGRDAGALGPSDSSDSGSDMAGVEHEEADPNQPVDVALQRDESTRPLTSGDILEGPAASDAAGTGERRTAGSDAGPRDAADISPDRIVDTRDPLSGEEGSADDDEDPDLAFMDDEEGEDEEGEPDGDVEAPDRNVPQPRRAGDPHRTKTS